MAFALFALQMCEQYNNIFLLHLLPSFKTAHNPIRVLKSKCQI